MLRNPVLRILDLETSHPNGQPIARQEVGFFDASAVNQRAVAGLEIANNQGAADFADLTVDPADPAVIDTEIGIETSAEDGGQVPHGDLTNRHIGSDTDEFHIHDDLLHEVELRLPWATRGATTSGRTPEELTMGFS